MIKVVAMYCGGICVKYFASEEEAFESANRAFGPIYSYPDDKEGVYHAIVDDIEMDFEVSRVQCGSLTDVLEHDGINCSFNF